MTRQLWRIRSFTLAGLWLTLCLAAPSQAANTDHDLRAYSATYSVKGRGISLGTAGISLQPSGGMWLWRMTTQANAFVSLFTNNKPFSETTFTWDAEGMRLQKIRIADENDRKDVETARFDWEGGQMNVLRKGKQRQVQLSDEVYDLQSIHLRTAIMQAHQENESTFQLYHKGKLHESKLAYVGNESLRIGDREIDARVYEHSIIGSEKSLKYYYDAAKPTVPLLIVDRKSGKNRSELRLRKVDW